MLHVPLTKANIETGAKLAVPGTGVKKGIPRNSGGVDGVPAVWVGFTSIQ